MGAPQSLKSTQHIVGTISGFTDANGNPATVDASDFTIDDAAVAAINVSAGGMVVDVIPGDMAVGDAPRMTVLRLHVTENGVADAITDSWDMMISAPDSPLATQVQMTFGTPIDK